MAKPAKKPDKKIAKKVDGKKDGAKAKAGAAKPAKAPRPAPDKAASGKRGPKPPAAAPAPLSPPLSPGVNEAAVLDRLWAVVQDRRDADPAYSHSARLLGRGRAKVAQKFGEEAVECLIEAMAGDREALVAESADVLYHLIVLWVDAGVRPERVWAELRRREGVSGIAEKAARGRLPAALGVNTTKIP